MHYAFGSCQFARTHTQIYHIAHMHAHTTRTHARTHLGTETGENGGGYKRREPREMQPADSLTKRTDNGPECKPNE
jgi:hypothetical protein